MLNKRKVLFLNPYYLPGFRSGGPQQTIKNVVDTFGDDYSMYILTYDHDMGVKEKYPDIKSGWNQVGKAKVMYLDDNGYSIRVISHIAKGMDVLYCCGLWERPTIKALFAQRLGMIRCKVVIAPMGVFSKGAICQKKIKKRGFLALFNIIGCFKNITWSFSSELEKKDAEREMGGITKYIIAEDLPRAVEPWALDLLNHCSVNKERTVFKKEPGELRIVFLSRICYQKNLLVALYILDKEWNGSIFFDIYGSIEDKKYWEQCQIEMKKINTSVIVKYRGEVKSESVPKTLRNYHALLLPTRGENFGHVIYEGLSSGCLPIISDQTIWNDLEKRGCGFVSPLEDIEKYRLAIQQVLMMNQEQIVKVKTDAIQYASEKYKASIENSNYKKLFS